MAHVLDLRDTETFRTKLGNLTSFPLGLSANAASACSTEPASSRFYVGKNHLAMGCACAVTPVVLAQSLVSDFHTPRLLAPTVCFPKGVLFVITFVGLLRISLENFSSNFLVYIVLGEIILKILIGNEEVRLSRPCRETFLLLLGSLRATFRMHKD